MHLSVAVHVNDVGMPKNRKTTDVVDCFVVVGWAMTLTKLKWRRRRQHWRRFFISIFRFPHSHSRKRETSEKMCRLANNYVNVMLRRHAENKWMFRVCIFSIFIVEKRGKWKLCYCLTQRAEFKRMREKRKKPKLRVAKARKSPAKKSYDYWPR